PMMRSTKKRLELPEHVAARLLGGARAPAERGALVQAAEYLGRVLDRAQDANRLDRAAGRAVDGWEPRHRAPDVVEAVVRAGIDGDLGVLPRPAQCVHQLLARGGGCPVVELADVDAQRRRDGQPLWIRVVAARIERQEGVEYGAGGQRVAVVGPARR